METLDRLLKQVARLGIKMRVQNIPSLHGLKRLIFKKSGLIVYDLIVEIRFRMLILKQFMVKFQIRNPHFVPNFLIARL